VIEVCRAMVENRQPRVLVMQDERLVGTVSSMDVLALLTHVPAPSV
jgi:CBS domain-containing protein